MRYIGVDIHKKQFTVCYRENDSDDQFRVFENNGEGMSEFLASVDCMDHVAVETGCFTRHFVKCVREHVHKLVTVDVVHFRLVTESVKKTDKHDAAMLAMGMEKGILPIARFRSEASQQLRSMLTARENLVNHRRSLAVQMHALLSRNGVHVDRDAIRVKANRDLFNENMFEAGDWAAWSVYNNQQVSSLKDLRFIDIKIRDAAKQFPGYDTLMSIPGIGPVTCAMIIAYIDDIDDFRNSKAFCAFFGIVPRTRISDGKPVPTALKRFKAGSITKKGCIKTRSMVVMAVNRLITHNASLRDFYEKIKGRKGYRKARTAAGRKFLTFLYFALKRGGPISDFSAINFSKPSELN